MVDRDALVEQGWTTFPLLVPAAVSTLRGAFDALGLDPRTPFHATQAHSPRDEATRVDRWLTAEVRPSLAASLPDLEPFVASFILKGEGSGWVSLHQDWTFVDEREARSYVVWCPLVDVGADSGAIHVLPGSHRWSTRLRGSGDVPGLLADADADGGSGTWAEAVAVPLAAGEAVMYDTALLHGSTPTGDCLRPVVAFALAPSGQRLLHVHRSDGTTTAHRVDAAWFTAAPHGERPVGCEEVAVPGEVMVSMAPAELCHRLGIETPPAERVDPAPETVVSGEPAEQAEIGKGLRSWIARARRGRAA